MAYRLTFAHILSHWWIISIHLVFVVGVPFYVSSRFGAEHFRFSMFGMLAFLAVIYFPLVLLHARYVSENLRMAVSFDLAEKAVTISKHGKDLQFRESDIADIATYKTRSMIRNSLLLFPWDSSCYALIRLKDGQHFVITSLLIPRLDWPLDFGCERVVATIFPWPRKLQPDRPWSVA